MYKYKNFCTLLSILEIMYINFSYLPVCVLIRFVEEVNS